MRENSRHHGWSYRLPPAKLFPTLRFKNSPYTIGGYCFASPFVFPFVVPPSWMRSAAGSAAFSVATAASSCARDIARRSAWQQKGSVPGLVKLLKAFLSHDAKSIVESGQITQVLGVIQQRLIPSKINDGWGFELLQSVVQYLPACVRCSTYRGLQFRC